MIRIVGYLVADATMIERATTTGDGWFTIWEAPPNLSASQALERAAARFRTWEARLRNGSHNGVTRVALEAVGPDNTQGSSVGDCRVRGLEVRAREERPS